MNQCARTIITAASVAALGALIPLTGIAAAPDAGRLLEETKKAPVLEKRRPAPEIKAPAPVTAAPLQAGMSIEVKGFRVVGNSIVATPEVEKLLREYVNKTLTFGQLEQAAELVTRLCKDKGYITSYAYLPRQEINAGIVEIGIITGVVAEGGIKLKGDDSLRLDPGMAQNMLAAAIPVGTALRRQNLERGLILLNELPGINAKSTIVPGATASTSELLIEAKEGRLYSVAVEADNFGNRYSGQLRGTASLNVNNPSGHGDLLGVKAITSGEEMNYVRPFYTLPVNRYGTRLGIAWTWMAYKLGKELKDNGLDGSANTFSAYLTHPVARSLDSNLFATFNYDVKMLQDRTAGVTTTDKNLHVFTLGLSGDKSDNLLSGGATTGSLTITTGLLDLSGSSGSLASDAASAKSNGSYARFNLSLGRTQNLSTRFSLALSGACQLALDNLDSSEKFSLGGPSGVRAFPGGEGSGDEGYTVTAELRYDVPPVIPKLNLQVSGFFDNGGVISLHKDRWSGWQGSNPDLAGHYNLNGAGVGLSAGMNGLFAIRASWAWKIDGNPGAVNGKDSNGKNDIGQLWVQGSVWF